jgi:hypothetical protein
MKISAPYPPTWLKMMKPEDRASLGKAGLLPEEIAAKTEVKNERQLQSQIIQYLRLKGVEPLWHRTDKKSAATIGWPDITFAIYTEICIGYPVANACAYEVKFGEGKLSKEQEQMHLRLSSPPNCWRIRVIRSLDEVIEDVQEMGIT